MKRILIALFLVLSIVICLSACNDPTPSIKENPEFAKFNEMFKADFQNYTITVSSTNFEGHNKVTETYVVSTVNGVRKVNYTIEELNLFIVDGDSIIIPDSYMKVTQGVYEGEDALNSKFNVPHFNFSYKYITNDLITSSFFGAEITSLSGFMGLDNDGTGGAFKVSYSNGVAQEIEITYYDSAKNIITITYSFK